MAMRATMSALAAAAAAPRGGLLRLLSTTSTLSSSFPFPQTTQQTPAREQAEPNTNLFVSGKCLFLYISYSYSHILVIYLNSYMGSVSRFACDYYGVDFVNIVVEMKGKPKTLWDLIFFFLN